MQTDSIGQEQGRVGQQAKHKLRVSTKTYIFGQIVSSCLFLTGMEEWRLQWSLSSLRSCFTFSRGSIAILRNITLL